MNPRALLLLVVPLVVGPACSGVDEARLQAYIGDGDGGPTYPNGDTGASTCKTVTVSGNVFYNDLRWRGRFLLRDTPTHTEGVRDGYTADGSHDNKNYLGLLDGQIDIFEVDNYSHNISDSDCVTTALVGSTSITADGSWTWTGSVCDACNIDSEGVDDTDLSFAVKVSLRKCDHPEQRCFSLRDPTGAPYDEHYDDIWDGPVWSHWIRSATVAAPKVLHAGTTVPTGTDYFQASATQTAGVVTDAKAQAANVFASLVDVTRKVHLEENIPYDHAEWGEVKAYFPNAIPGTHSHQMYSPGHPHLESRLCISGPGGQSVPANFVGWTPGDDTAHEYGHFLHYWQWEGSGKYVDLCYQETQPAVGLCGEGDPWGEYTLNAFKEGWANFIRDVTFENTGSTPARTCDDPEYIVLGGRHFKDDVEHALCNLRSNSFDDTPDPYLPFALVDNHYSHSLLELRDALGDMWWAASLARRDEVKASTSFLHGVSTPLGICEFAQRLADADPTHIPELENVLAVTSIDCDL